MNEIKNSSLYQRILQIIKNGIRSRMLMSSIILLSVFLVFLYLILFKKNYFINTQKIDIQKNMIPLELILNTKNINGFLVNKETLVTYDYIIYNFWATWCPPCIEETPSLLRFVQKNSNRFFLFAISQDSSLKDIEVFLKSFPKYKNKNIEILWDDNRNLAMNFKVNKLPETFVYQIKKNKLIKISGSFNWDEANLINKFETSSSQLDQK